MGDVEHNSVTGLGCFLTAKTAHVIHVRCRHCGLDVYVRSRVAQQSGAVGIAVGHLPCNERRSDSLVFHH